MANNACDESFVATETTIQREVEDIKKRNYVIFVWTAFSVLLITSIQFPAVWYVDMPPEIVGAYIGTFFAASVIIYAIVGYLWVNFIKPESHVHVMGSTIARSNLSFLTEVFDLQRRLKPYREHSRIGPQLLFFFAFISVGLALSSLITWFATSELDFALFGPVKILAFFVPLNQHFEPQHLPIGPIIIVVVLGAAALVLYHFFPKKTQSAFGWLLAIPTLLSSFLVFLQIFHNSQTWWNNLVISSVSLDVALKDYAVALSLVFCLGVSILLLIVISVLVIDLKSFYTCVSDDSVTCIEKMVALLPQRVRVDSSHALFFSTKLSSDFINRNKVVKNGAQITGSEKPVDRLEIELQADGLTFDGAKQVTIRESSEVTSTAWNCSFPKSGVQTINIVLNAVSDSGGNKRPIFIHKHKVTVDSLFTVSWLPILVAVIPILTALIGVLLK
jgi:hypothetical protein